MLDRYGLHGCGGPLGPVESIGFFARAHGVDEARLLRLCAPGDDAAAALEALAERYQLGVITNGNADVRRLGLSEYFQFALCAEELGVELRGQYGGELVRIQVSRAAPVGRFCGWKSLMPVTMWTVVKGEAE